MLNVENNRFCEFVFTNDIGYEHTHVVPCVDYGAGIDFSGLPSLNVASHDNISNKILVNLLVNQEPP